MRPTTTEQPAVEWPTLLLLAATYALWALGTTYAFKLHPAAGILLIMGIDQILDMGRTLTNVLGNGLATAAVAKWQGEVDPTQDDQDTIPQAA